MNLTLEQVITDFRNAQDRAVATIRDDLKWKIPSTNAEWVSICCSEGYPRINEINGIIIYTHGYGIELTYPDLRIDFDWGANGEGTGFDTWKLWNHCKNNNLYLSVCSHDAIKLWIEEAHAASELVNKQSLWYRTSESNNSIDET